MKVYVINLDKDISRMAYVDAQLRRLCIAYERIPGVYAKNMTEVERCKAVNRFRWWCAVGRKVVPAEIGCALSHYGIYKRMSSDNVVCILEDDIKIDDAFAERLQEVESFIDKTKPQVVMLSSHNCKREGRGIIRSKTAVCTDAYVITQLAAKALLGANLPMQVPCDHWWRWERMGLIELYHALPTVASQNQEIFGTSTQANADDVSKYPPLKWCLHKAKRLVGKTIDLIMMRFES